MKSILSHQWATIVAAVLGATITAMGGYLTATKVTGDRYEKQIAQMERPNQDLKDRCEKQIAQLQQENRDLRRSGPMPQKPDPDPADPAVKSYKNIFEFTRQSSCTRTDRSVTCQIAVKNLSDDRIFNLFGGERTYIIDDRSNNISVASAELGSRQEWNEGGGLFALGIWLEIAHKGTAPLTVRFDGVPRESLRIAKLFLGCKWRDSKTRNDDGRMVGEGFSVEFRDIPLSN